MNNTQAMFWNRYYQTAKSIGCNNAEAIKFADKQLSKATWGAE